jgi:hypothetical protein
VFAYDETYKGRMDLSKSVFVGLPVKKSGLRWSVPYDVTDEAGNVATTVWRDVVVEEVDLVDVEAKIRHEFIQHQKDEVQKAVEKALAEERKKNEREMLSSSRNKRKDAADCPGCPKCNCDGKLDESMCAAICENQVATCAASQETFVIRAILLLEQFCSRGMARGIVVFLFVALVFIIARILVTLLFNRQAFFGGSNNYEDFEREQAMMNAVTYYDGDRPVRLGRTSMEPTLKTTPPPRASVSTGNGLFTPPQAGDSRRASYEPSFSGNGSGKREGGDFDDIYMSPPQSIISPRQRGSSRRSSFTPR